jgi:hAT family C-terminal dimerisation region
MESVSRLLNLALNYAEIPATSSPSEKVFSTAGEIVSRLRTDLKPSYVDMLVFL